MMDLVLPVKKKYFDEIKSGIKKFEYRELNAYWSKRISNKRYDNVIITLGYPKKEDNSRRMKFKWTGYNLRKINHPHFGNEDKVVYAIPLIKETE